jgi:Sulfotransferase domain
MTPSPLDPCSGFPAGWFHWPELRDRLTTLRPGFLVISPPKTGTSWVAFKLGRHPEVFVPKIKEVRYFNSLWRWSDLGWYLDHFRDGVGRLRGEASPSYAILPVEQIRRIHQLWPDLKLIFLMREPLARAWSHAKHSHRYGEVCFESTPRVIADVPDAIWQANLTHEWSVAMSDYLGQLRRWMSVFPREQMYVDFFESIAAAPEALLRDLFAFLGVEPTINVSDFELDERIFVGPEGDLPTRFLPFMHTVHSERTRELAAYLRSEFGLEPPAAWRSTLEGEAGSLPESVRRVYHDFGDGDLTRILAQEDEFPSAYRTIQDDYLGYRLVVYRGRLFALSPSLDDRPLWTLSEAEIHHLQTEGECFIAPTVAELKAWAHSRCEQQSRARSDALEAELRSARQRITQLEEGLGTAVEAVRRLERDTLHLSAKEMEFVQRLRETRWGLRSAWRRLWETFTSREGSESENSERVGR